MESEFEDASVSELGRKLVEIGWAYSFEDKPGGWHVDWSPHGWDRMVSLRTTLQDLGLYPLGVDAHVALWYFLGPGLPGHYPTEGQQ